VREDCCKRANCLENGEKRFHLYFDDAESEFATLGDNVCIACFGKSEVSTSLIYKSLLTFKEIIIEINLDPINSL
jgi:hypothetical protein